MASIEEKIKENLSRHGVVCNIDDICSSIRLKSKRELNENDIEKIFEDSEVRYYNYDAENEDDCKVVYNRNDRPPKFKVIVLSNEKDIFYGEYCISFTASGVKDGNIVWKGCLFGKLPVVFKKFNLKKPTGEKIGFKYANNEFYNFLYSNLLIKEKWKKDKSDDGFVRLFFYLTNLCAVIKMHYGQASPYYRESVMSGKKYILFDSKLLDKYGNNIFLIHRVVENNESISFTEPVYVSNTECLKSYGFEAYMLKQINPVMLYENPAELIFQGNIEDFDLDDTHHLKHIIDERRERLPRTLMEKSPSQIYMCLKMSVEYEYGIIRPTQKSVRNSRFFV